MSRCLGGSRGEVLGFNGKEQLRSKQARRIDINDQENSSCTSTTHWPPPAEPFTTAHFSSWLEILGHLQKFLFWYCLVPFLSADHNRTSISRRFDRPCWLFEAKPRIRPFECHERCRYSHAFGTVQWQHFSQYKCG